MIKNFNYYIKDKKIFDNFINLLPRKFFDFHVHLWEKSQIVQSVSTERKKTQPLLDTNTFNEFTYNEFKKITRVLFEGIHYSGLFFGAPLSEVDIMKSNKMIEKIISNEKTNGLFIPRPSDNYLYLINNIKRGKFVGFKPYPDLANRDDPKWVSIKDFLTEEHLNIANNFGLIILLHIPKPGRLNDNQNINEIKDIALSFPNIKLVLAHTGRSYCLADIKKNIKKISVLRNVYVDTAMINNWEVVEILLKELGPEKILYGSDLPISALRGKNICINDKHYFITSHPHPWSLSKEGLKISDFTFFLYEEIREILKAISKLKLDHAAIKNIFYKNAINLLNNINIRQEALI
ncbi:hypothetical protein ES705_01761 [subsurface metagenome]|nr:amidohydrolase family protein [Clostridia bacterium]